MNRAAFIRNHFETKCKCAIKRLDAGVEDSFVVKHYEQTCVCDANYTMYGNATDKRDSGRTTSAIINAPRNCVYVWPHSRSINYPTQIAFECNRKDIIFVSFNDKFESFRLTRPIVFDHACYTSENYERIMGV